MRRSREEEFEPPTSAEGAAMRDSRVALFLILLSFQGMQVKATEKSLIH